MKKKNLKTLALAKNTIAQLDIKSKNKIVGGLNTIEVPCDSQLCKLK